MHPNQVLFFNLRVLANQLLGYATVLRQHQQAHRIDVQSTRRRQAPQVPVREPHRRQILRPAVSGLNQLNGWRVPIFGLSAHISHRFVQEHRDTRLLQLRSFLHHFNVVGGAHLHAHQSQATIDMHPTPLYPVVRLSS